MASGDFNPPLFYWIEHIMLMLGNNEVILRFIPALCGVLTIPVMYCVGKDPTGRRYNRGRSRSVLPVPDLLLPRKHGHIRWPFFLSRLRWFSISGA